MFPEYDVRIYDCIAEKISYKQILEQLEEFKPDWVIVETVSSTLVHDLIVAHFAKSLGAKTVIISPHTEALKEETLKKFPSIDHIVDYEKFQDASKPIKEPESHLRELITGEVCNTQFEDMPIPRQDLLPISKYRLPFIGNGYTFIITSRGCPYRCSYCRQGVTWKNRVRYRPVDLVIEEIKRYSLKNIAFHADTATVNKGWIMEFCKKVPPGVRWVCNSRVDTVDPEMLKAMKSAGCWMICFGQESGNDEVLKMNEKGGNATVEQARKAFKWTKDAGIKIWFYAMLGLYGDTKKTMRQTIDLTKELSPDIVNFAVSAPYPGTRWHQIATEKGFLIDHKWSDYDQNYSAIVDQPDCSHQDVKAYQRKGYLEWYLSWRGLRFLLHGLRPQYGSYFWQTIRDHLKG